MRVVRRELAPLKHLLDHRVASLDDPQFIALDQFRPHVSELRGGFTERGKEIDPSNPVGHAGDAVAVMEVECRSRGDGRCRFLAGSPDTMATLYDRMAQGMGYTDALGVGVSV